MLVIIMINCNRADDDILSLIKRLLNILQTCIMYILLEESSRTAVSSPAQNHIYCTDIKVDSNVKLLL